jgi:hypothetical protein
MREPGTSEESDVIVLTEYLPLVIYAVVFFIGPTVIGAMPVPPPKWIALTLARSNISVCASISTDTRGRRHLTYDTFDPLASIHLDNICGCGRGEGERSP